MIYNQASDTIDDSFFTMSANIVNDGGSYDADGLWVDNKTTTPITCHIQPLNNSDIQSLPEGTIAKDCKKIYTSAKLSDNKNVVIEYGGRKYTLYNVQDYSEYNYYKGLLILIP